MGIKPAQFQMSDPLETASKSLALQGLMGQQDMQALQMKQAKLAEADDLATREAFAGGGGQQAVIDRLLGKGLYKPAQAQQKSMLETREKEGTINKNRAETMGKLLGFQRDSAGALMANPTQENALTAVDQFERMATSFGMPELSQQAATQRAAIQAAGNNPDALRQLASGWALAAKDLLPKIGTRDTGGAIQDISTNPVTGVARVTATTPKQDLRSDLVVIGEDGVARRNQPVVDAKKAIQKAGASSNTTIVNTEKTYAGKVAGGLADMDLATIDAARTAPQRIQTARSIKQILDAGNVTTGTAAESRLAFTKALSTAGIIDGSNVKNTEDLASLLGSSTLDAIKGSGLGSGQGFTDNDRRFLERAKSGNIEINAGTLRRLADLNEKAGIAAIEAGNKVADRLKDNPNMGTVGRDLRVPMPAPVDANAVDAALKKHLPGAK